MEEDFKQSAYIFEGTVIAKEIVWVKDTLYPILVEKGYLKAGLINLFLTKRALF
jgi:hypothetical protein